MQKRAVGCVYFASVEGAALAWDPDRGRQGQTFPLKHFSASFCTEQAPGMLRFGSEPDHTET